MAAESIRLHLRVSARAARPGIVVAHGDTRKVRVSEPAERGRASGRLEAASSR